MTEQVLLSIEPRRRIGKSGARQARRQGRIPGVIYGHGEPEAVSIDQAAFRRAVKPEQYGSAIVRLRRGNEDAGAALVKSVHTNTLRGEIVSLDLQRVTEHERVHVSLAIVVHGEPVGVNRGGVLDQPVRAVNLRCPASTIPAQIDYDVTPLDIGDAVHAGQLALPSGAELLDNADEVIAVVLPPTVPALEEPVEVAPEVAGPELTEEKQKDDFPPER